MPRQRVIIELSPSTLAVRTYRGDVTASSRAIRYPLGEWPSDWIAGMNSRSADLAGLVIEFGCEGCPCLVVYHAPGSVTAVTSCSHAAGATAALDAARLQLSSLAASPTDLSPSDFRTVSRDVGGSAEDSSAQVHVLGIADSEENAAAIVAWAEKAGLRVEGLVPQDAAAIVSAIDALSAPKRRGGTTAAVWLGEHGGALAVGGPSRLLFVRTLGIGVHDLAEAMTTCSGSTDGGSDSNASKSAAGLDLDQSRAVLVDIGIPTAQQALPGLPGLTGASVLPALQPLLQRLAVEIKQSLRFGVSEEMRAELGLCVCGPGSAVGNLASTLSRMTGCGALREPEATVGSMAQDGMDWGLVGDRMPRISSTAHAGRLVLRHARRALKVGVGAAAAVLLFNAAAARMQLTRERERFFAIQTLTQGTEVSAEVQQVSVDARLEADALAERVRRRLDGSPAWGATLAAVSAAAPPVVKLTDIAFKDRKAGAPGTAECVLHGRVTIEGGSDPIGAIRRYSKNLEACPLVAAVRLGSTQIADTPDGEAQTFELSLTLVGVPREARVSAAGEKESQP